RSKEPRPDTPANFLGVATTQLTRGYFVMVAGYPGRSYRYRTESEVTMSRDFTLPMTIRYGTDLSKILTDLGTGNRQTQIRNASRIRGFENTLKNNTGALE